MNKEPHQSLQNVWICDAEQRERRIMYDAFTMGRTEYCNLISR